MSVKVDDKVIVNVVTMTANYVTNTVMNSLFRIANERGLSSDYIYENRNAIERGLFTWVSEQSLKKLALEVFSEDRANAWELHEFEFKYVIDPRMEAEQPPISATSAFFRTLKDLPKGTKYRVIVNLTSDASPVEGWDLTTGREIDVQIEKELGGWGFGYAEVKLIYKGSKW